MIIVNYVHDSLKNLLENVLAASKENAKFADKNGHVFIR